MTSSSDDHQRRRRGDYDYEDYPLLSPPPFPPRQAPLSETYRSRPSHTVPILLPLVLLFFFLVGFFSIYLLHYLSTMWISRRRRSSATSADQPPRVSNHGLDPSVIASFPIFPYGVVRGLSEGGPGLECAICISELRDGDTVRLLTVCSHVFHAECIDEWLVKHTTCPVCRSDLEDPSDAAAAWAAEQAAPADVGDERRESYTVYIGEEEDAESRRTSSERNSRRQSIPMGQRGRWQSTGHIVDDGRYTLSLTDVEEQRIARYHTRAKSR